MEKLDIKRIPQNAGETVEMQVEMLRVTCLDSAHDLTSVLHAWANQCIAGRQEPYASNACL